jgi:hypothetical protein
MKKWILVSLGVGAVVILGFYALNSYIYNEKQADSSSNYLDGAYMINGEVVELKDGYAEHDVVPGSASKVVTRYFGNDFVTDLNNDGREDVVFLLTQETGGSGTMFYAVGALHTEAGYVGSDGYFLGDRIAPQTIDVSPNPRHKNVVVVNYSVREIGESMTSAPSVGTSVYLKLDPSSMMWGIVEPNFEGESR